MVQRNPKKLLSAVHSSNNSLHNALFGTLHCSTVFIEYDSSWPVWIIRHTLMMQTIIRYTGYILYAHVVNDAKSYPLKTLILPLNDVIWAIPSKKGPYLICSACIWKRHNRKCDVILSAPVKKDVMITNHKSEVSSLIERNIFWDNKYFEGFRWILLSNSNFNTKILKDPFCLERLIFMNG
jgi:hypothetical protein